MKLLLLAIATTMFMSPAWAQPDVGCVKGNPAYPGCLLNKPEPTLIPAKPGPIPGTQNYDIKMFDMKGTNRFNQSDKYTVN